MSFRNWSLVSGGETEVEVLGVGVGELDGLGVIGSSGKAEDSRLSFRVFWWLPMIPRSLWTTKIGLSGNLEYYLTVILVGTYTKDSIQLLNILHIDKLDTRSEILKLNKRFGDPIPKWRFKRTFLNIAIIIEGTNVNPLEACRSTEKAFAATEKDSRICEKFKLQGLRHPNKQLTNRMTAKLDYPGQKLSNSRNLGLVRVRTRTRDNTDRVWWKKRPK